MSSLSSKSAQEISDMLDEYGIKHGPVVDSTRSLYEKKLREAMTKRTKAKPSPDKTFYREEEEEVTYVYRTPVRSEGAGDGGSYMRSRPEWTEREIHHEPYMYDTPSTYRSSYLKSTPMKPGQDDPKPAKSSRLIPLWVQFVFFLVVAAFLYLVFSTMETNVPLKGIE